MLHNPARADAQEASVSKPITFLPVTTFKLRDQWSRMVAREPRVKLSHRNVLSSLALCTRVDKGGKLVINPTYDELAEACLCSRRTAMRAIAAAEDIGIVRKVRQSDGRVSNAFELMLLQAGSNGDKFAVPTVTNIEAAAGSNGDSTCHRLKAKRKVEVRKKKKQEETALRAVVSLDSIPSEPREEKPVTDAALNPANGTDAKPQRDSACAGRLVSNLSNEQIKTALNASCLEI